MLSCAAIEIMYFTGADFHSTPHMAPILGFRNKTTGFIETYEVTLHFLLLANCVQSSAVLLESQ